MTIRQLKMLESIPNDGISIDDALTLNQTTFGSLCFHNWLLYDKKSNAFLLSTNGLDSLYAAHHLKLHREKNNYLFSKRVRVAKVLPFKKAS